MKLTIQHYDKTFSIETDHEDLSFDEMMDDILRPALIATGWSPALWEQYFMEEK